DRRIGAGAALRPVPQERRPAATRLRLARHGAGPRGGRGDRLPRVQPHLKHFPSCRSGVRSVPVMTNPIGIVQGRLSPPVPGRLQAFPSRTWREEFGRARTCGFSSLEWVFEADNYEQNPIWTQEGVVAIRRQIDETGVRVDSICADYFMTHPLFG